MDTRVRIHLLLDYKEYYGADKTLEDAIELIRNIPSVTLLNYLSGFAVNLYLYDNDENTGKIQFMLVSSLLDKCGKHIQQKWVSEVNKQSEKGFTPMMFWNYSNLLFYGLIFKVFNNEPSRDLTGEEAKVVFDTYLIINGIANSKIQIEEETIKKAEKENKIEDVTMPNLIYQKDYVSSLDFSNQVTRGIAFFKYLENDPKYKELVLEYYKSKNVNGYLRLFKNLMVLFSEINIGKDLEKRNQLANLQEYSIANEIDLAFIETLCINTEIESYEDDESFGTLRNKFLFKLNQFQFFILNVNFLLDQFYKAQIFSFNSFLKSRSIKSEFLSEKGKNFTEGIYLPTVLDTCFPHFIRFYGDDCINSKKEELCDVYLREANKICLIEFKDVLLSASIKNGSDKEKLFAELEKKFLANQSNKPKGVTQLLNAIKDINDNSILFDGSIPKNNLEIYPVIVYTDSTFGIEGVNKYFKEKFVKEIENLNLKHVIVKDVIFINLNYFEIHEDYFNQKYLDLYKVLNAYLEHIKDVNYALTPFEVFSRFYMNTYVPEILGSSSSFQKHVRNIFTAK
ncbi:hypothetical protein [Sediminibacterium sp. C3]|uniref:hypothetical protein n=1 Tax=Sediminibacterium sp. C3 TaxID=1267211 RepID=UPI0004091DAC|nr:hypothetical protein [Sediminibacterium sp. C3]